MKLRFMLMLMLAGCTPGGGHPEAEDPGVHHVASAAGTYQLWLRFPDPIPANEEMMVEGWVRREGAPLPAGAHLDFDAGMPQHRHGLPVPATLTVDEGGHFVAEGVRFHMGGKWLLMVDVTEGPYTERAQVWVEAP